ncbi:TetR family transcriptional regulator [Gordonia sp. CPCC 206044]|uniref:TetR/AcrR family transcriptional regulator n=1 Tax=Gordonia sp. CPCC 206044 TaxID=3140793 RepID=UPI003AF3F9C5
MASASEHASGPRRRNAAATREALLQATRTLLAEHGAQVTTRDIAAEVGVNQALINRYFGSKEQLFVEAVRTTPSPVIDLIADGAVESLPEGILHAVLEAGGSGGGGVAMLAGVVDNDTITEVVRDTVEKTFTRGLAERLDGPHAELRAELVNALVVGISLMRQRIGSPALAAADLDEIAGYVGRMTEPLLKG